MAKPFVYRRPWSRIARRSKTLPAGILFDAASGSGYQTAQSTYSWSHTCTGANRYLVVGISMLSVAGSSVSSITYNGVAMSLLGARASVSGAIRVELWGLVAPATGSNTIAVTLSAGLDSVGSASSFTGVHQTSPTEGEADASATNVGAADATVDVTTVADNDMVVDVVATSDTAITVGAGQTSRNNQTGTLGSGAMSTEGLKTPAGVVTMSWTNVAALATWSIAAIALRPIAASALATIVNVAGVAGTGSAGGFAETVSDTLSGVSATGGAGGFVPTVAPGTGGVAAAGSAGGFTETVSDTVAGVAATGSAGIFGPRVDELFAGVSGVGSAGSFVPTVAITPAGVFGTGAVSIPVFFPVGVSGTGQAGGFVPTVTITFSGVSATGATGSPVDILSPATAGVTATGGVGTFTPEVDKTASGVSGAGSAGSFVPKVSLLPSGVAGVGAVGGIIPTGGIATGSPAGVFGTGGVGVIGVSITVPASGRPFSASLQRVLNQQYNDEAYLVLAELTHESIGDPIRVANNTEDVTSNGYVFTGFPFEISLPGDEEGPPKGTLSINNIDRSLGLIIRGLNSPVRVRLMMVLASAPDTVWLDFKHFWLRNIKIDALSITGDIDSWDFATEPWPNRRATAARAPALFR